jgi:type 1 glutamine amidotransferase
MGQDRHLTQTYGTMADMPRKAAILALAVGGALLVGPTAAAPQQPVSGFRVLAYTKTAGFRHASIPAALQALRELGARNGFTVDATEDPDAFTDANLARYAVVAFVLTTGDVLDAGPQAAFQRYIRRGHGFVGIHSAADTEHDWPWYGRLVGAYFKSHPPIQPATLVVADPRHSSTASLPERWGRTDEWYNFTANPRPAVRVLATLDETTYSPGDGAMGPDHPIAWVHEFDGGRAWYTGGGHTEEAYSEPLFRAHLLGGIRAAAGLVSPSILSIGTTQRSRRLSVAVRYTDCLPCAARVAVRLPARTITVPMRLAAGLARATTPVLPTGRWTLVVTMENAAGRRAFLRTPIRIR